MAITLSRAALVHWGRGGWRNAANEPTRDSGLGYHLASSDWHDRNYEVGVAPQSSGE